jgi:hypothetical protein
MREIICDTTFYFSPTATITKNENYRIVGTKWSGWELITSSRFSRRGFHPLQKAALNFLKLPHHYIKKTPFVFNMMGQYDSLSNNLSYTSFATIERILKAIIKAKDFDEYQHSTEYIKFREYDNRSRRDMEEFLRKCVTKAKEYMHDGYDPQLMYTMFDVNFKEIVYDWYYKHFGITIYKGNIHLNSQTAFVQVLLAYFQELFSGAKSVGNNDFNDLLHLLYVRNNRLYNTGDKKWRNYMRSLPIIKEQIIV